MSFKSIGLEIHIFLTSKIKAFSPENVGDVSWISLGFPGTLPSVNLEAIKKVIQISFLLNCRINYDNILFDRKNYFYYDLPRGYQITQHFHPIGKDGFVVLSNGKRIRISTVHFEEDTAQQFKNAGKIHLNFERLGRPLVEIVTAPDFENYSEIEEFLQKIRRLCAFNRISFARYEEGEMRIDLNISVRNNDSDPLPKKSEVKNLNSLFALKSSLEYILDIQQRNLEKKIPNDSLTYAWIARRKTCEVMRKKGGESDYFYVPEANIPKISFTKQQYKQITDGLIFDFDLIREDLSKSSLKDFEIDNLLNHYEIFELVKLLDSKLNNLPSSYNWIANVIAGISDSLVDLPHEEIEKVILDAESTKKISFRIAKDLLREIIVNKLTYKQASKHLKVSFINDTSALSKLVSDALNKYKDQIPSLSTNLPKLERLIIGECMKLSNGQANPVELTRIFREELNKYI